LTSSGIDVNTGAAGNQNFAFIGTSACTAVGQWRYGLNIPHNLTLLAGNVTGVSGAAFQSVRTGLHHGGAGDFRLSLPLSW
jgi:hypothetical protein